MHLRRNQSRDSVNNLFDVFLFLGCLSGGFSVQLSDGFNSIKKQQFDVQIKQLEVKETVNKELSVFPGMEALITMKHLMVETSDLESIREVVFLITNGPTKGRLLFMKVWTMSELPPL